jgi:arylsulfatase A-like enzyme
MRSRHSTSRLAIAGALGLAAWAGPASAQERPNILLIIADDVGLDTASGMYPGLIERLTEAYGPDGRNHPEYRRIAGHPASTPVLDGFARQGMVFTQAWAHPFCSPSRAAMLTGLYAKNTGVSTYADPLTQAHHSFVNDLHGAGYRTGVFGKWHMAGLPGQPRDYPGMKPREAGFDVFHGNMHAALPTFWDYQVQVQDSATPPGEWRVETPVPRALPGIAPTLLADVNWGAETVDWIRAQEAADPDKPWFGWLAFNLAHATARQTPSAMMVPDRDTLDAATIAEMEACGGEFGSQNTGTCSGEALQRAMTNAMDTIIGKVLAEVDRLDPNTYVIFVGDNGTPMYGRPNLDLIDNMYITRSGRGKGSPYESGARVMLAVRGPGIAPGSRSDEFVHVVDLFPTILQLAGLAVPDQVPNGDGGAQVPVDGISLRPILTGATESVRDPVRGFVLNENTNLLANSTKYVGARNATYKVACTNSADNCAFYDLVRDPLEEFPLDKPASCAAAFEVTDPAWHYCYLTGVIVERSIF